MDMKCAFLNGIIDRKVYVAQPPSFENKKFLNHVFKLFKSLYGLRQAPKTWYESFSFEKLFSKRHQTIDTMMSNDSFIIVQIYVDDKIFVLANEPLCADFGRLITSDFDMSMMSLLNFFLGLQIKQTPNETFIHQEKYRGMIGSLMYLTSSRPDIIQSVEICSRFQSQPKESHLSAVKRIIRYIQDTSNFNFAGDRVDRRSTSGIFYFLGRALNVWSSKKQFTVALSIAEAKYITASFCYSQLL
ncbi:hypothetical protein AAHE18_03G221600 [Arachis hypogaea]